MIALIEKALAPQGASVSESVMLTPLIGGEAREVDVLVEFAAGNHSLRIAIECRDHSRKQGVEWIEQLFGKYCGLPVDVVVAVSRNGFTKSAAARAVHQKIRLLSLQDATNSDWVKQIDQYRVALLQWNDRLVSAMLRLADDSVPLVSGPELMKCLISDASASIISTVEEDVLYLYRNLWPVIFDAWRNQNIEAIWRSGEGNTWHHSVPFLARNRFLIDAIGNHNQIAEVILSIECRFGLRRFDSSYFEYNGSKMALGSLLAGEQSSAYQCVIAFSDDLAPNRLTFSVKGDKTS